METILLEQLKEEMLNVYGDIYSDFNLLQIGKDSHFSIIDYIDKNLVYNDSLSFDFAFLKEDEYIYPGEAVYGKIKEEGLDIIRNDSIRTLTQNMYVSIFPRLTRTNSFNPDISETLNTYYLNHFKANTDYSLYYNHTFNNDTLSGRVYNENYKYPIAETRKNIKRKQTIGFVP